MKFPAQSNLWRMEAVSPKNGANGLASFEDHRQSRELGRFRQIFPLNLFPSSLIVEELRLVHVRKQGPWSAEVNTIMATDIACVYASTGLILGSIHIKSLTGGPEIYIGNLTRHDVLTIRSLVEGIALASREGLKINQAKDLDLEKQNFLNAGAIHYG